ncbi:hypothetical protein [Candidatus Kuenenia stuttgartiensis]|uniref:hypothetical protein n=1 Tax=Kuenenia stuttgartiensis TaxID=174633 RepID=UPI001E440C18|nr:hypothetical protein [Candidatus Kuenenia stuttgartiensis]
MDSSTASVTVSSLSPAIGGTASPSFSDVCVSDGIACLGIKYEDGSFCAVIISSRV